MSTAIAMAAPAVVLGGLLLWLINWYFHEQKSGGSAVQKKSRGSQLPPVPEVPGLPVIGNALQLREGTPHMTFAKLAKKYGPIFSIRVGSKPIIVVNSEDIAKEAMVTRFSSITRKNLSKTLSRAAFDRKMVALCDYGDFHKTAKRHLTHNVVGPNAQKQHRVHRDTLMDDVVKDFHAHVKNHGLQPVNFRDIYSSDIFGLALKEAIGRDVEYINVEELGRISRPEILKILLTDPVEIALQYVDLGDYFPYLKWIPQKNFERKVEKMYSRRLAVMKALIKEQTKRAASGEEMNNCYLKYLLAEGKTLTEKEITSLVWEVIIESSDTTMITTEWALFELAKNPKIQERLCEEIRSICGSDKVTEDNLCQLPFLDAVFHETLRKYPALPMVPLRYVNEDIKLGGYYIPAGSEIAINLYGCNMNEKQWERPDEWNPDRFLDGKKEYVPNDLYKTMAFGAGKRLCAGSQQGVVVGSTTIGRLVQEFEWRLENGEEKDVDIIGIATMKLRPMHAVIRPRNL
ncbi:hypothetical protein RHSIM_Rhsim07G0233900 [Rhododendron simsii]|uniref:Ent-kaurene oxidase n=1 Tax=Rhododendron simsii TaxID=118357 RepID=A0A834GT65_RHOSS|nr:hypothetical protein RHSIM_Rhsim07G0233900 [Rhododendron simsii]